MRKSSLTIAALVLSSALLTVAPAFSSSHIPAVEGGNFHGSAADGYAIFGCRNQQPDPGYWGIIDSYPPIPGFYFGGHPADLPITGDWDGNGFDSIGVFRDGQVFLRNSNSNGSPDVTFWYGNPGDQPIAGDWNGDGIDTIGVYRNGLVLLRNSNSSGAAEISFWFGDPGDVPIAGDWDGDGIDTIGVWRPSNGKFYLRNSHSSGAADIVQNGDTFIDPYGFDPQGDGTDQPGWARIFCGS